MLKGDIVKTDDSIGKVGHTCTSSGNHLHYEAINGNQKVVNKTLMENVIINDFNKHDFNRKKATCIPPTIIREDHKNHFNKRYYIWRICVDDKFCSSHTKLEGKAFSCDNILFLGEDYNCRCWAEEISE